MHLFVSYSISPGLGQASPANSFAVSDRFRGTGTLSLNNGSANAVGAAGTARRYQSGGGARYDTVEHITSSANHGDGWNILSMSGMAQWHDREAVLGGIDNLRSAYPEGQWWLGENDGDAWMDAGGLAFPADNPESQKVRGAAEANWDGGLQDVIYNLQLEDEPNWFVAWSQPRIKQATAPGLRDSGKTLNTFFY